MTNVKGKIIEENSQYELRYFRTFPKYMRYVIIGKRFEKPHGNFETKKEAMRIWNLHFSK